MGQYHRLTCPSLNAAINPYDVGCLGKAIEQCWDPMMGAALGLVCAHGFGQHPRSLPWIPKGQWAGRHVMMIGDYAEDADGAGHPITSSGTPLTQMHVLAHGKPSKRRKSKMTSIGRALMPALERITAMRSAHQDASGRFLRADHDITTVGPIVPSAKGWSWDCSAFSSLDDVAQHVEYAQRIAPHMAFLRPPLPMVNAPDSVPSAADVGCGEGAMWVSIDAQEFVDPVAFGALDLAATLQHQDLEGFILTTLFQPRARGGGDYDDYGIFDAYGRWYGDRLALVGPKGIRIDGQLWTHNTIRAQWRDVTPLAQAWTTHIDNLQSISPPEPSVIAPDHPLRQAVIRIIAQRFTALMDINSVFEVRIHPPTMLQQGHQRWALPPSVRIEHNGHNLWLTSTERASLTALLTDSSTATLPRKVSKKARPPAPLGQVWSFTIPVTSAHNLLSLHRP